MSSAPQKTTAPAPQPQKAKMSMLKRYFAQSIKTDEERKMQDQHPVPDPSPFTLRQFANENVSQAIPVEAPPNAEAPVNPPPKEPEDPRSTGQRIKEAFKKGEEEVSQTPEVATDAGVATGETTVGGTTASANPGNVQNSRRV